MALLSEKTRKFIKGRSRQFPKIEKACAGQKNIVWVHAASFGEFEEARPVIEAIRSERPDIKILVTFFSPSGYEYHKDSPIADWVFYLPLDTRANARRFLDAVNPIKVIVSISDYWLNFLFELRRRKIDTYLISARFTESMFYFKPMGFLYREAFKTCFSKIMVRDRESMMMLARIGATNAVLMGDPRMDRVMDIASREWSDPIVDRWAAGRKVFVAGSTLLAGDDALMVDLANSHPEDKFLIIPHEQDSEELNLLRSSIDGKTALYSEGGAEDAQVLIIDTVGMLSKLYRYGFAAYVGGGFDGAPHSIIEPAAYGIPVAYGPEFGSHYHCIYLIECGAGTAVRNPEELGAWYDRLKDDAAYLAEAGEAARKYCENGSGVAASIAKTILYGNRIPE